MKFLFITRANLIYFFQSAMDGRGLKRKIKAYGE